MARRSSANLDLLRDGRRAVLATTAADGRPRLVPITYAVDEASEPLVLYSALDEKPKSVGDVRDLARVRDIVQRPRVTVLVDRWSEDWVELAWLRLDGRAALLEPGVDEHATAVGLLRGRYSQYEQHALEERPIIRIEVDALTGWSAAP